MAGGACSRFSPLMASILECDQKIVSRGDSQKETMAICRIYVPEALSRSLFAAAFRLWCTALFNERVLEPARQRGAIAGIEKSIH
jgi:hypothetical protein